MIVLLLLIICASWYVFKIDWKGSEITPLSGNIGTTTPTTPVDDSQDVKNVSVVQNQGIRSPLKMTGEARLWYFEGSFPVEVRDAHGKVLGSGIATAQGDWMTENFVSFNAEVVFASSTTETGTLVLRKDNPSGLKQYDAEISIPVRFLK